MRFVINKLDRRHAGYRQFTHYINPVYASTLDEKLKFFEWRNWCWTTFGPGPAFDIVVKLGSQQFEISRWAWHINEGARRLYFASEKELSQFCLFWS
jgi:hypothetical protein